MSFEMTKTRDGRTAYDPMDDWLVQSLNETQCELEDCKQLLRELGRFCGCDHVESPDDREQQTRHIEEAFENLKDENRRLRTLLENPCWQIVA